MNNLKGEISMSDSEKLTVSEKGLIVLKSAINALPYVGGSLSTLIFDWTNEKRIKRLESFYYEITSFIKENNIVLPDIGVHDKDSLVALIEELHTKIEHEHRVFERNCLMKFYLNSLSTSTNNQNFDERTFFLDSLSSMTVLECEILSSLMKVNRLVPVTEISKPGTSIYAIVGAIGRLKAYGYLTSVTTTIVFDGQSESAFNESVKTTPFGKSFIEFCLFDI